LGRLLNEEVSELSGASSVCFKKTKNGFENKFLSAFITATFFVFFSLTLLQPY
jgi:hypothetical protein